MDGWSGAGTRITRLAVADAQPHFRVGVQLAARGTGRLEPVAEAADVETLLGVVNTSRASVVVVGTNVPVAPGAARSHGLGAAVAVRRRFPSAAVVVVSETPREAELFDALRFGTAAYVGRAMEAPDLGAILVQVADGRYVFDAAVLGRRPTEAAPVAPPRVPVGRERDADDGLGARDLEVLSLVARGRSNRAIGEALEVSGQTAKNYVTAILRKLGVSDRTQAVVQAIRLGLMKA